MQAYDDHPLPIGHGQTISQPYIVAFMTEALGLRGGETVLEVGTGSGYQAAVLAEIAGRVYSIEIVDALANEARARLSRPRLRERPGARRAMATPGGPRRRPSTRSWSRRQPRASPSRSRSSFGTAAASSCLWGTSTRS